MVQVPGHRVARSNRWTPASWRVEVRRGESVIRWGVRHVPGDQGTGVNYGVGDEEVESEGNHPMSCDR